MAHAIYSETYTVIYTVTSTLNIYKQVVADFRCIIRTLPNI